MTAARHLVVVAVAESSTSDALAEELRAAFTVRTAYDGESLRESLDETVDVILFDPDLPGISPESLSDEIESHSYDCQVGVIASMEATEAPAIADAVIDESAPLEELERVIARLAARADYQKSLERLYELATRRADLVTREAGTLDEEQQAELERIENRLDRLRVEIGETLDRLDDEAAFEAALERLDDES